MGIKNKQQKATWNMHRYAVKAMPRFGGPAEQIAVVFAANENAARSVAFRQVGAARLKHFLIGSMSFTEVP